MKKRFDFCWCFQLGHFPLGGLYTPRNDLAQKTWIWCLDIGIISIRKRRL